MTTAAELSRFLAMQRQPEYDAEGRCLHTRAHYVDLGPIGRDMCPDCYAIKWGNEWPVAPLPAPEAT